MRSKNVTIWVIALAVMLVLFGPLATNQSRGNFFLFNDEQMTVNSYHYEGTLFQRSRAFIVSPGEVSMLEAYHYSVVDISGGTVSSLAAWNYSTVYISSGSVDNLSAKDYSVVDVYGGGIGALYAENYSDVDISGGTVNSLYAWNSSVVTFYGRNFRVAGGLVLDGDRVLGTGELLGEWMDGTQWLVNIVGNDPTATIMAVPEPATLLLLGLGAVMLRRRLSK